MEVPVGLGLNEGSSITESPFQLSSHGRRAEAGQKEAPSSLFYKDANVIWLLARSPTF